MHWATFWAIFTQTHLVVTLVIFSPDLRCHFSHWLLSVMVTRGRCYDFKNIFDEKNCEKLAFLTRNNAKLCKFLIIKLDFEENANFSTKNWQKSQKIVIITSTPDWENFCPLGDCLRGIHT
jgi:hypothetical protein